MTDERQSRPSPPPRASASGQWARLRIDIDSMLRRGGWYRVLSLTAQEVTLSVNGKPIRVSRDDLEFRTTPPRRWTVLRRPGRVSRVPERLRAGYMVCPNCRNRAALPSGTERECRCARCNVISDIAWEENYLSGVA